MSRSQFVCGQSGCGVPLTTSRNSWRHALGGKTGAIPASRKHRPVPVLRTDYDQAYAISTPVEEARELLAQFRAKAALINPA